MTDGLGNEPDEDDVLAHRFVGGQFDVHFSVGTGYGKGDPNFYVTLGENETGQGWWLDGAAAVALGEQLIRQGQGCLGRS